MSHIAAFYVVPADGVEALIEAKRPVEVRVRERVLWFFTRERTALEWPFEDCFNRLARELEDLRYSGRCVGDLELISHDRGTPLFPEAPNSLGAILSEGGDGPYRSFDPDQARATRVRIEALALTAEQVHAFVSSEWGEDESDSHTEAVIGTRDWLLACLAQVTEGLVGFLYVD